MHPAAPTIRIDRQAAHTLACCGEDRIGHCSTDNGRRSFTNATRSLRVLDQVCLHHRYLVDTHRQIVVKIALLDPTIFERDRAMKCGRQPEKRSSLNLGFDRIGINVHSAVKRTDDPLNFDGAIGRYFDLGDLRRVTSVCELY
ncbi:hypothetical protein BKD09_11240 [Bradyrhizobium japonicum]|uniref:Uncharacterized protein n=1 Tax=Bradyrhizobium japonicum TaxID=375 RepID=A0A1L3F6J1_BRAJP|nr:hypothetical protein BKD09_11240 [Bradyrhizobium japonicum]